MAKWLYIAVPLGLGWVAFEIMQPGHWTGIRQGLILPLALLGAAVLVRLARGMPVSTTEHFEVEEMRRLSQAVIRVYRALIVLFVAIICSTIGLIFIEVAHSALGSVDALDPATKGRLQQGLTGLLVFFVAFALARTVSLIKGDYDLVKLQARLMERAVERRHAAQHAVRMDEAEATKPFEKRPGYGKIAQ